MDEFELSKQLVDMLRERSLKIASVESCTGGLISKIITDAPGSSEVFDLGITTYSNEMKNKMVGVPNDILERYGAVSPQTAQAMAEGILRVSGADIGIATTGIAGPGGGTPEKPVGLVYTAIAMSGAVAMSGAIAMSDDEQTVRVTQLMMGPNADRDYVRRKTAEFVLLDVIEYLKNVGTNHE